MKAFLVLLCILGSLTRLWAQGTLQFAASLTLAEPFPPFAFTLTGEGLFNFDGSTFFYQVRAPVFAPWTSQIRGPGPDGPVLFDLRLLYRETPLGTNLGSSVFRGSVEVPEPWIADLVAERWYVTATYHDIFPGDVNLRGQIQLVPEPSAVVVFGLLIGVWVLYSCAHKSSCSARLTRAPRRSVSVVNLPL